VVKAQILPVSVASSGAVAVSDGSIALRATVGQSFTGLVQGRVSVVEQGFWHSIKSYGVKRLPKNTPVSLSVFPSPARATSTIHIETSCTGTITVGLFSLVGTQAATILSEYSQNNSCDVRFESTLVTNGVYIAEVATPCGISYHSIVVCN
jgi:hypothetical protein